LFFLLIEEEEHHMKKLLSLGVVMGVLGFAVVSQADQNGSPSSNIGVPKQVTAREITIAGSVQSVNPLTRDLKIQPAAGDPINVKVSPEAAKLTDLKQGEQIRANCLEPVAVAFQKDALSPIPIADKSIQVSSAQNTTGMGTIAVNTVAETTRVAALDQANRTVTLVQKDGTRTTLAVAPNVKGFDQLKVGDVVLAEYTQPFALEITPA
jgi:hypothetical protein